MYNMNEAPVRTALKYVEVPFQVYAIHSGDTYYAAGSRTRPVGKAVTVTELIHENQHNLMGVCQDGSLIIFGGASAKHWIVQDVTAETTEYEKTPSYRPRPASQGDNHYLRKMSPEIRKLTDELRTAGRRLTLMNQKLRRLQESINEQTKKQSELRQKLADEKRKS